MSSIYFHIPFCKQACHYCDFHFSTSLKNKEKLLRAMQIELQRRREELPKAPLQSIYFGGGTPSLLSAEEIEILLAECASYFNFSPQIEITLEANPDDLHPQKIEQLSQTGINRLSIGVQSFFEEDLQFMNRAHHAQEALDSIELAKQYFDNLTVDLIYGIPTADHKRWEQNLQHLIGLELPHISAYALTVEEKTVLAHWIRKKKIAPLDEKKASDQFHFMVDFLTQRGYEQYELSNFGKEGYYSVNNTAYWEAKPYLGIGPSAHSFDGNTRSWNIANNSKYCHSILEINQMPITTELLSENDKYNEYIMTALRTKKGIGILDVTQRFGTFFEKYLKQQAITYIKKGWLEANDGRLYCTQEGKFFSDGIASDLFYVD
ncbi:MAG: radical SAM family heme chaperone HemW [Flavobacteriaceae bacterium]|nr:radical SAM family heme chaperone HemW [Flavobacteriaceae bacterium]